MHGRGSADLRLKVIPSRMTLSFFALRRKCFSRKMMPWGEGESRVHINTRETKQSARQREGLV